MPVGDTLYAVRPYGFDDAFRGNVTESETLFIGKPITQWLSRRGIQPTELGRTDDLQAARLFPLSTDVDLLGRLAEWFLTDYPEPALTEVWRKLPRLSADELSAQANLPASSRSATLYKLRPYPLSHRTGSAASSTKPTSKTWRRNMHNTVGRCQKHCLRLHR